MGRWAQRIAQHRLYFSLEQREPPPDTMRARQALDLMEKSCSALRTIEAEVVMIYQDNAVCEMVSYVCPRSCELQCGLTAKLGDTYKKPCHQHSQCGTALCNRNMNLDRMFATNEQLFENPSL
jgi:hypothetical protein